MNAKWLGILGAVIGATAAHAETPAAAQPEPPVTIILTAPDFDLLMRSLASSNLHLTMDDGSTDPLVDGKVISKWLRDHRKTSAETKPADAGPPPEVHEHRPLPEAGK